MIFLPCLVPLALLAIVAEWVFSPKPAHAADLANGSAGALSLAAPLSLDAAIARALRANPELARVRAVEQEAQAAVQERKTRVLPKISGLVQYAATDDPLTQLPDANQAIVKVDENVFDGGRFFSEVSRLRATESGARFNVEQKRLETVLAVKAAFFRGLQAQGELRIWKAAQAEFSRLRKLIEPKFTVGSVPEYDYAKVELSLTQYGTELRTAEAELRHALMSLGALMGGDPPAALLAEAGGPPAPPTISIESFIEDATASRPEVHAAESRIQAQGFAVQTAQRERLPNLLLEAEYGLGGYTWQTQSLGWDLIGTISFPIFDFGTISSRVSQAQARRIQSEARLEALRLRLRTQLSDLAMSLHNGWSNYQAAQSSLPRAERAYRSSLRRYRTGIAPMTELSDAHELWVQARVQSAIALAEYRIALAQYETLQEKPATLGESGVH